MMKLEYFKAFKLDGKKVAGGVGGDTKQYYYSDSYEYVNGDCTDEQTDEINEDGSSETCQSWTCDWDDCP